MALLVNKRILTHKWAASYHTPDLMSLMLQTEEGPVQVINIYSAVPRGPQNGAAPRTEIGMLPEVWDPRSETILVGDFNLHHSRWGSQRVQRNDQAAHQLIQVVDGMNLRLATPVGAVTWKNRRSEGTTIDLTFLSPGLFDCLVLCRPIDKKDEVEDHTALETVLEWSSPQYTQYRWFWKETDPSQAAQGLHIPR